MEYRTFHSTQSNVQQPIRGLVRTVFRATARLGSDSEECVSKAFLHASGNGIFANVLEGFHDFARAIQLTALLLLLRFSVWRDGSGYCANQDLVRAIFGLWRASPRGLANIDRAPGHWLRFVQAFRTTEFARYAISTRTFVNRIFAAPAQWAESIARSNKVSRLFPHLGIYPQNSMNARSF